MSDSDKRPRNEEPDVAPPDAPPAKRTRGEESVHAFTPIGMVVSSVHGLFDSFHFPESDCWRLWQFLNAVPVHSPILASFGNTLFAMQLECAPSQRLDKIMFARGSDDRVVFVKRHDRYAAPCNATYDTKTLDDRKIPLGEWRCVVNPDIAMTSLPGCHGLLYPRLGQDQGEWILGVWRRSPEDGKPYPICRIRPEDQDWVMFDATAQSLAHDIDDGVGRCLPLDVIRIISNQYCVAMQSLPGPPPGILDHFW